MLIDNCHIDFNIEFNWIDWCIPRIIIIIITYSVIWCTCFWKRQNLIHNTYECLYTCGSCLSSSAGKWGHGGLWGRRAETQKDHQEKETSELFLFTFKKTQQTSIFLYPDCFRLLRTVSNDRTSTSFSLISSVIFHMEKNWWMKMDKSLISCLIFQGCVIPSQKDSFKNAQVWSGMCWSPLIISYLSACSFSFTASQQKSSCFSSKIFNQLAYLYHLAEVLKISF